MNNTSTLTLQGFMFGIGTVFVLTLIGHLILRSIVNKFLSKERNRIWDEAVGQGYVPVQKYSSQKTYNERGRRHTFVQPGSNQVIEHVGGYFSFGPTFYFVFLPLLGTYIYGLWKGSFLF